MCSSARGRSGISVHESVCVHVMSHTPFFLTTLWRNRKNQIWTTTKDREERTEGVRECLQGAFHGATRLCEYTHFKRAVNIQKVLFEALLNNASFTADLWPHQPLRVSGQLTPAVCRHTRGTHSCVSFSLCVWLPEALLCQQAKVGPEGWSVSWACWCVAVMSEKRALAQKRSAPLREKQTHTQKKNRWQWRRGKRRPSQKSSDVPNQQKWMRDATIWGLGRTRPVTPSYQLSGQEKVLLPCHHHTNTFALLSAAQHGHKFLLAAASHVYSVHLHTREKMITARRLLHQRCKWRIR